MRERLDHAKTIITADTCLKSGTQDKAVDLDFDLAPVSDGPGTLVTRSSCHRAVPGESHAGSCFRCGSQTSARLGAEREADYCVGGLNARLPPDASEDDGDEDGVRVDGAHRCGGRK